jgi:uncharacterized protein (DUF4415 family)
MSRTKANRLQRALAKAERGESVISFSPLGDRGEARPALRSLEEVADPIAWEEAQMASQPKVSINLRVRPDVLAFFRGLDPRGYQRRINAVLEAYARVNRRRAPSASRTSERGHSRPTRRPRAHT